MKPDEIQPGSSSSRLSRLLAPKSVAIIGASGNVTKLSGRILANLGKHGFPGSIWPVNPSRQHIEGLACHPDIGALPNAPDLGIVALNPKSCVAAVEELASLGTRACAVLSSGFSEVGPEGAALERRLAEIAQQHGMLLLGPNCLGFLNAFDKTAATFSQYAAGEVRPGPVAFVSQSGAFGTAVAGLARQKGIGLGWFVNTGNEAALDVWDVLGAAVDENRIDVVAAYVENLGNGRKMVELARHAAAAGKPLVLVKVGNSVQGAKAAAAHTGALATPARVFEGIASHLGIVSVADEREMLNAIEVLLKAGRVKGRRFGVVTMSGGAGVQMADLAEALGSPLPDLSQTTRKTLKPLVPKFASINNPVDVTAQFIANPEILSNAVAALQDDPDLDCIIVWLQMMDGFGERIAEGLVRCRNGSRAPLLVTWVAAAPDTLAALRGRDIATFETGVDAVRAAVSIARSTEAIGLLSGAPALPLYQQPPVKPRVLATGMAAVALDGCGVPLVRSALAVSEREASDLAHGNQNFAFKIASSDIPHRSDIGGVVLNVQGRDAARHAFTRLMDNARAANPEAEIEGVEIQPMMPAGLELAFGYSHDPSFGPVVMLGYGGVFVEHVGGERFAIAPVSVEQATAMIDALPAQRLLDGTRGFEPVDRLMLARAFAGFSEFVASRSGHLDEVDLNPIIVDGRKMVAVDWLVSADRNRQVAINEDQVASGSKSYQRLRK